MMQDEDAAPAAATPGTDEPGGPLRVVLADDHPVVRSGVRLLIENTTSARVVAEAGTPDELFAALERHPADIVLTDLSMPSGVAADGLGMLGRLQRRWPGIPLIVLTMVTNPHVLQMIRGAGVHGLLNKSDTLTELALALHAVAHGRTYLGSGIRRLLEDAGATAVATAALSPREAEVLRLYASGLTVSAIARHLDRSVKTVSRQKMDAMAKLGLRSDLELYAYARGNGLIA